MANTPVITSPSDGSSVSLPVDITGTGSPNAVVEARDDAGLLLPATLNPVSADGSGNWTIHVTSFTGTKTGSKNYAAAGGAISDSVGTNLLSPSAVIVQMLNATNYAFVGSPLGTVTVDYAAGPSGAYSGQASRFQWNGNSGAGARHQTYNGSTNTQYTISWYAKLNSGSHPAGMWFQIDAFGSVGGSGLTPQTYPTLNTETWTRVSHTITSRTDDNGLKIWVVGTDTGGGDVLLWGLKMETGASATGSPSNLG